MKFTKEQNEKIKKKMETLNDIIEKTNGIHEFYLCMDDIFDYVTSIKKKREEFQSNRMYSLIDSIQDNNIKSKFEEINDQYWYENCDFAKSPPYTWRNS